MKTNRLIQLSSSLAMLPAPPTLHLLHRVQSRLRARSSASHAPDLTYLLHAARRLQLQVDFRTDDIIGVKNPRTGLYYNFLNSYTDFDGLASLRLAADKIYCYQLMQRLQLPVPRHIIVTKNEWIQAVAFSRECPGGIVIKPARDTGDGLGVCILPGTPWEIFRAAAFASIFSKDLLVEEFRRGTNYRLLYCQGEFVAASSRLPATVTGDGRTSVRGLIRAANRGRRQIGDIPEYSSETRPILYQIPEDGKVRAALARQKFHFDSVPPSGSVVQLQEICHWLWGGSYWDVTEDICPDLVNAGAKLVKALGIRLAGVDIIADDIRHCDAGNYVINEINTTPALLVHYEVQNRDQCRPVAELILERLFR